ncbi:MotA/TolQ/ExbB proton channel family protein [Roseobacter sinensis]|uniref:MotA/TolQ/ExbB proton channel family protein n=1 Tax=Roseobacter sinensis TaxID=2931391 RepID=A0ABT3BKD5_9RHOB|nr:MotA/TolQ/ExbB proton channel family protein [Roseobacter sp. WL0113]MCV3274010.1 MotA/TolQ/ExbB proton channel family protein [Roseobacter sp. WL0113]
MLDLSTWIAPVRALVDTGGPVVLLLLVISVLTLAVILYKLWQFARAGVGRHRQLAEAMDAWDADDPAAAQEALHRSSSYLAPLIVQALASRHSRTRATAEAEGAFARLENGLRWLDTVAQLAPLLGLFGTVLGMIDAFRALQDAGSQVDPSVLAGGIWVALLTTAAGLSVAMPAALALSWFDGRMARERLLAQRMIEALGPAVSQARVTEPSVQGASHA